MKQDNFLRLSLFAIIICGTVLMMASCGSRENSQSSTEGLESEAKMQDSDEKLNWTKLPHQFFSAF